MDDAGQARELRSRSPSEKGARAEASALQPAPVPSCDAEPTLELMTVRLGELVNARMEPTGWICVYAHAVSV